MNQPKKKILFLTSEISPFSEVYQLADFSKRFSNLINDSEDFEIRISQPKYGYISERKYILREVIRLKEVPITFNQKERVVSIKSAFIPNTRVQVYFLIDKECFFDVNPLVYKSKNGQFKKNNFENYSLFCLSLLESFKKLFWYPDFIICNDWQSALLPGMYNKHFKDSNDFYKSIKTLLVVHSYNQYAEVSREELKLANIDIHPSLKGDVLNIFEVAAFETDSIVILDTSSNQILSDLLKLDSFKINSNNFNL